MGKNDELDAAAANKYAAKIGLSKTHLPHGGKKVTEAMLDKSLAEQTAKSKLQEANRLKKEAEAAAKKKRK